MPLQPQLVVEPFDRWALDFVGPINPLLEQGLAATEEAASLVER